MRYIIAFVRIVVSTFVFVFFLIVSLALVYEREELHNITYFEMLVGVLVNGWACINMEMWLRDKLGL